MSMPIITVDKLNKSYGAVKASQNISFSIEEGHIHALIGPNGAGKTTLVNQLTGDILPDRGTIRYHTRDITRLRAHKKAKLGIARSFQITHIFPSLTVAENMALAINSSNGHNFKFWKNGLRSKRVQQNLKPALERVDLHGQAPLLANSLSHGEKRQLEVGMALVGKPELLILDEPMAGMGPGGTIEMTKLIQGLKGTLTILLVEHDMDVVFSLADRITVLVYGEVLMTGTPEEIQQNRAVQEAYLGEHDA